MQNLRMKEVAKLIEREHQVIMDNWEEEVVRKLAASQSAGKIALHDHLPNILDDIVDILLRYDNIENPEEDEVYRKIIDSSSEHGRHRATTPNYTVEEIVREYIIFHQVITRLIDENKILDLEAINFIKYLIETAILESVTSFSESLQEMQTKLIGTLAHDIRNPLSAARMATEMIDYKDGEERLMKVKKMAFNSINRALEMIEGLLESISAKSGEGMMLKFSEGDIMQDVNTVYAEACEIYDEDINLFCTSKKITGVFDGTAIRRVLENLITNAIKYGDSLKPISIKVEDDQDMLSLSVHNYGNPIPLKKQKDIFKFLTSDNENNSTELQSWGIGLSLVKMVIEAHNGNIDLQSSESFGTEFKITLNKHANQPGKMRTQLNYIDK